jgi:hypothetical protein
VTLNEAKYVLANRHLYDDRMYMWAVEIVETARRQGIDE